MKVMPVKLNKKELEDLKKYKKILENDRNSTTFKILADIGKLVIKENKYYKNIIKNIIKNNIRKNKRNLIDKKRVYRYYIKDFCEICNEKNTNLEIHHINENHSDNRKNNLFTVCPNCHKLIHNGKRGKKSMIPLQVFIREKG